MREKMEHRHSELSLVQRADLREQTLAKMRRKLANQPSLDLPAEKKHRVARRKGFLPWISALALGLSLLAGNLLLHGKGGDQPSRAVVHRLLPLSCATVSPNPDEQALCWTFAMYDVDRLRKTFAIPEAVVIDAKVARRNLEILLPRVDARTRFTIEAYRPYSFNSPKNRRVSS